MKLPAKRATFSGRSPGKSVDSFHSTSTQLAEKLYTSTRRAPSSRLKQSRLCDRDGCHSTVQLFGCGYAALGHIQTQTRVALWAAT
jgi:hypothetical protein